MPQRATPLTAQGAARAVPGRHYDGDGLCLLVRKGQARPNAEPEPDQAWWLFRFSSNGKVREMGLGRARGPTAVTLSAARASAAALRDAVRAGLDPLAQREVVQARELAEKAVQAALAITFKDVAERYMTAHEDGWRNPKHRQQWRNTLKQYAYPHMGALPVSAVDTSHVMAALETIWRAKPETASRVRGRVESVLDYAKARGWRGGENPARWRGHLDNLLPARGKVQRVQHHAALPYPEIAAFTAKLRQQGGIAARALEFAILAAARTGEVLGARWCEIDLAAKLWTVPADRMKAGKEHRVPLTDRALDVLKEMAKLRPRDDEAGAAIVFPGAKHASPLSNMAMLQLLRRMGRDDLTAHGFRSTFRDWAAERTNYPSEVAEMALAHAVSDKVEAAYRRGDMFEKRRRIMEAWATFCAASKSPARDNVQAMRKNG
jgi:integrase